MFINDTQLTYNGLQLCAGLLCSTFQVTEKLSANLLICAVSGSNSLIIKYLNIW